MSTQPVMSDKPVRPLREKHLVEYYKSQRLRAKDAKRKVRTYFIYSRVLDAIKIGRTALQLDERYAGIADGLEVVFILDGDYESTLHKKLSAHRVKREWFAARAVYDFLSTLSFERRRVRSICVPRREKSTRRVQSNCPTHMEPYLARQMYLEMMDRALQ